MSKTAVMEKTLAETCAENVANLVDEAKSKYEQRKEMLKSAREIETELADEEITVSSANQFQFGYAFGETSQSAIAKKKGPSKPRTSTNGEKNSRDLILEFMKGKPNLTASSADLSNYFTELGRSTPAPTLTLMVKNKLIESVSRGVYRVIATAE